MTAENAETPGAMTDEQYYEAWRENAAQVIQRMAAGLLEAGLKRELALPKAEQLFFACIMLNLAPLVARTAAGTNEAALDLLMTAAQEALQAVEGRSRIVRPNLVVPRG